MAIFSPLLRQHLSEYSAGYPIYYKVFPLGFVEIRILPCCVSYWNGFASSSGSFLGIG